MLLSTVYEVKLGLYQFEAYKLRALEVGGMLGIKLLMFCVLGVLERRARLSGYSVGGQSSCRIPTRKIPGFAEFRVLKTYCRGLKNCQ